VLGCCSSWLICVSPAARASALDGVPVELTFSAPAGCPERDDVLRAMRAQLPAGFRTSTRLRARAQVLAHSAHDFELVIEYSADAGAQDVRRVRGESCEAAADAAALLLSLALIPSPAPEPPPRAAPQPIATHNEIGVVGVLDSALMPKSAFGGGLQFGISFGAWRVKLSVLQWGTGQAERGTVHVQFDYWSAGVGLCYLVGWPALQTGPCAQLELGRMTGYADNVVGPRIGAARVQALGLSAQTRLRLYSPIWLLLEVGFEWVERSPRFEVADIGLVHQPDPFGLRLVLGPFLIW
jgi:hypothetical protein